MQKVTRELYIFKGQEYTLEQIDQLRNEFIYLSENIEKLSLDETKLIASKKAVTDEITILREEFDKKVTQDNIEIAQQKEYLSLEIPKRKKELSLYKLSLDEREQDIQSKNELLDSNTVAIIAKEKELDTKISKFDILYKKQSEVLDKDREELEIKTRQIVSLSNDIDIKIRDYNILQEKQNDDIGVWNKEKDEYTKDIIKLNELKEYVNSCAIDNKKKEESIMTKIDDNKVLLDTIIKEKEALRETIQDLISKEQAIVKKESDFQEDKMKFYTIMRKNNIKQSDLNTFEKDFNS